ncbi:O-glucosyltransferase rumi homolog [Cephus cinctus]|uniref:O-glucosyltransferase rumi homolog n=1 Tax=Cephus cinctus TaxID=211228 RepID=A0AAJ7C7C5_CEPCN|nr:O-glucosyltransferase rumi homolog [Cephus cinctus]
MRSFEFLTFFALLVIAKCNEQECTIDSKESCSENDTHQKYKKEINEKYNKYLAAVTNAEQEFVECNRTNCGCFSNVIARDLKPFQEKGISHELINAAKVSGATLYQIIKGRLYRETDCMFPSRCAGIEHFILKVIDKLPDMELIINTRDYPQSSKYYGNMLPVFSFSKTPEYFDILYPAWSFWEGGPAISLYPRGLGRWDQHRVTINEASEKYPWEEKESLAFFRGSRTSSERDNLILLSRNEPSLVDAQYTKNQAWKSDKDTLDAPPAKELSLEEHCKYKYLFNYRGVAASFRHKHLFLCRSLVFHVGNEWTEFYYKAMKPWIHYIPVPKDANQRELKDLILFAKENDGLAKKIANHGRDFIWGKLQLSDITCYWKKLLSSYAKLLSYRPTLDKNLVEIKKK